MLYAVDHGDGKLEPGVECGGGEKVGHIDMCAEVSEVVGDDDFAVAYGPDVVLELLAGVGGGSENHAFVGRNLGTEVVQVGVGEADLLDKVLHVVGPGGGVQEVVSERPGTSFALSSDEVPSVKQQRDPHHAQWTPLGDSTAP